MGDWCPKEGKHGIAQKLSHEAAVPCDRFGHGLKERVLKRAHLFRVETLGKRSKAGEIGEKDRHRAAIRLEIGSI